MASLMEKGAILQRMEDIKRIDSQLIALLSELKLVQHHIQDIPQFPRGAKLPEAITPQQVNISKSRSIELCIKPQSAHSYTINMPKRFEGIIQLQASKLVYDQAIILSEQSWNCRKELQKELILCEPESRKRAKLTKQLFPGILFQTLRRRAPLAPFNTLGITTTWCDAQKSLKKIDTDEALSIINTINGGVPEWQARKNIERIESAKNIYKKTEIRVHPVSVVRYKNNNGLVQCDPKKSHSPIIVLTEQESPISYQKIGTHDRTIQVQHSLLKDYKPLVEGSCLVYRT